jgi:hypothetical protein
VVFSTTALLVLELVAYTVDRSKMSKWDGENTRKLLDVPRNSD